MTPLDTPEERKAWIDSVINGRTFGSGLDIWTYPPLRIQDLSLREALLAFVGGLYVSCLLCSYAACEVEIAFTSVNLDSLSRAGNKGFTLESLLASWDEANEEVGRTGRTKEILRENRNQGRWMEPALRNAIIELNKRRRQVAHYQANVFTKLNRVGSGFVGKMDPPPVMDASTRRQWAQDAVTTVLTLWLAPQYTVSGGYPPDGTVMPTPE